MMTVLASIFKPGTHRGQRTPGFLNSFSLRECSVCVCVYAPEAIKISGVTLALHDWLNNSGCFSVSFYDLILPSMSSIGGALVTKCVTNYSQRRLVIYIAVKDVLAALHY